MIRVDRMISIALALACTACATQSIPIGRSNLTLPDRAKWQVRDFATTSLTYVGESEVTVPLEAKQLVYRPSDNLIKASLIAKVTKSAPAQGPVSWSNACTTVSDGGQVYKNDQSRLGNVDCLLVVLVPRTKLFLDALPSLKKNLGDAVPHTLGAYYFQYAKSIGAGGFAVTEGLLASSFKGLPPPDASIENNSKIPPAVLAWANAMAQANQDAVASFRGNWSIPPLNF
jgi:hypothetical protein